MLEHYPRAIVSLLAFAIISQSASGGADTTPPELRSLRFSPSLIDTSSAAAEVTITFSASDDSSGVTYFEAGFTDAMGSRQSASIKFEPARSITKSVKISFPRFSSSGFWTLTAVFLSDASRNTSILDSSQLSALGFPTRLEVLSTRDATPPKLTGLVFSPAEIDTSNEAADVKLNISATDDLSGVNYIELGFSNPGGANRVSKSVKLPPARSTATTLSLNFPRFSEPGEWTLSQVFVSDAAGNTLILNSDELSSMGYRTTLNVHTPRDTTSPQLSYVRYPSSIDVNTVEVTFTSPSGNATLTGSAHFTPQRELKNSVNVNFTPMSERGAWKVTAIMLSDAAGNTLLLDAGRIAGLGLRPLNVR